MACSQAVCQGESVAGPGLMCTADVVPLLQLSLLSPVPWQWVMWGPADIAHLSNRQQTHTAKLMWPLGTTG